MLRQIISGGQTGVDRAALDAGLQAGISCGGWCPKGRLAEDGRLPSRYPLRETLSNSYAQRTEWNVRDSDGTLILTRGSLEGGTALTEKYADKLGRPCLVIDLGKAPAPEVISNWVRECKISVLNVAGPRESEASGIYREALEFLSRVFRSEDRLE
jgi:Circularly permutated YpsA SLOG family